MLSPLLLFCSSLEPPSTFDESAALMAEGWLILKSFPKIFVEPGDI